MPDSTLARLREQVKDTPWPVILQQPDARALLAWLDVRIVLEEHNLQVVSVWPEGEWRRIHDALVRSEYAAFAAVTGATP